MQDGQGTRVRAGDIARLYGAFFGAQTRSEDVSRRTLDLAGEEVPNGVKDGLHEDEHKDARAHHASPRIHAEWEM